MNHYLLPSGPRDAANDPRYGGFAIPHLIQRCVAEGASPDRMEAKIFGGAVMKAPSGDLMRQVGTINISCAVEELSKRSIPIIHQDVGGRFARDVRFDTKSGAVKLKRIFVGTPPPRQ